MFQEWLKDYEKLRDENNMSEEDKIIDRVMMIDQWKVAGDIYTQDELNAIGELLDLYNKEKLNSFNLSEQLNKEKEKNKNLEEDKKYKDRIIKGLGLNTIPRTITSFNEMIDKYYIKKDKIRDLIVERQFELQQEFKDFKDDTRLNTLQEIYYLE